LSPDDIIIESDISINMVLLQQDTSMAKLDQQITMVL
jgi:hypothetical protein